MSTPVRVRFAPSPTGFLHLGGIRSALFNYLAARHSGGTFILRLEDTDRERLVEGAADAISQSLEWLGISPDEGVMPDGSERGEFGPYVQSKRLHLYRAEADKLLETGALYRCWCGPERLDALRKEAQAAHTAFKYDRHCLEPANLKSPDEPHVLRFRIPDEAARGNGVVAWDDVVRGPVEFKLSELDDFVALKSDGYPTYTFAVVVDDHLMRISHVLRGEEFVPTAPKNILLYEAFGWTPPQWVHLPQVLGPDKAKLSKRHGARPALEYRAEGYLPDAVVNFLASLGWNEGDGSTKEIYSRDELVAAFSLDRIQRSPAVFDSERLNWLAGMYVRSLEPEQLLSESDGFWPEAADPYGDAYRLAVLKLVHDRLKTLSELTELTEFFFTSPTVTTGGLTQHLDAVTATKALIAARAAVSDCEWTDAGLEGAIRPLAGELELKTGQFFGLLRVALTGRTAAPGLFETMRVLGRECVEKRLSQAINTLQP